MRVPGKYTIRYDCADLSGNAATPVTRTVYVKDTRCPKLTLKCAQRSRFQDGCV